MKVAVTGGAGRLGASVVTGLVDAGHEVMLQLPMEPLDARGNPGPQTLTTDARAAENLARLRWSLSRFTGYVGVVNYLGAKLTGDESALVPLVREISARGLGVLDDGSSARSLFDKLGVDSAAEAARVWTLAMLDDDVPSPSV